MYYKQFNEKAAYYKKLVEAGEKVFENTLINENELNSFIERLMENSDWDSILEDFDVTLRGKAEWYDNIPFFSCEYDDVCQSTKITLANSESAFRAENYLDDTDDPEEVYEVIVNLINEFVDYYRNLRENTIKKCQEEGSCFVNGWWIA